MPEIGEVARIVHYLRLHCAGRKIAKVVAEDDPIVYGKVGTSAEAFKKAMSGKTILDARQQGKYFWLVMSSPPHPLMHFGMTGWIKFSNDETSYYKPAKSEEKSWPPRFLKFLLQLEGEPACELAFVDPRRLGRIRLVDVPAEQMRQTTPLKENGPDPVIDRDVLTRAWLRDKLRSKRVPIKALLLDQAVISGVGNWVGDEVLYQARVHPEQYSNTLNDAQADALHDKLIEVCTVACDTLAVSDRFPETWLMKHRWNKGKTSKLPNGERIMHVTVGGRTSAFVPSVQKKTGDVAGDTSVEDEDDADAQPENEKPKKARGKKAAANGAKAENSVKEDKPQSASAKSRPKKTVKPKAEPAPEVEPEPALSSRGSRKRKAADTAKAEPDSKTAPKKARKQQQQQPAAELRERRRSGRLGARS